jgi:hypothetical protein
MKLELWLNVRLGKASQSIQSRNFQQQPATSRNHNSQTVDRMWMG